MYRQFHPGTETQPVQGISEMIAGRVAGVMVTQTSGDASASTKIRIRGSNSFEQEQRSYTL